MATPCAGWRTSGAPASIPWRLTEEGDRWYGRGTADNKGQHALNLAALEAVLAERGGRLGFNLKLVLETGEERGSVGLREFVAEHKDQLAADVLIGSDGPRVTPEVPTIATGTRGTFHFDLVVELRPGGVHSGHWGGLTTDPAVRAGPCDRHASSIGTARSWCATGCRGMAFRRAVRAVLAGCPVGGGGEAAAIDPDWGEPGLTSAEKIYGWNSFIVLAMVSGRPENPVNAVAPNARAHCQIRYTVDTDPATFARRAAPASRCGRVSRACGSRTAGVRMPASRTDPAHPWVRWTVGQHGADAGAAGAGDPELIAAVCRATCSSIIWARRWCGCRTAIMVASSTARTSTC